MKKKILLTGHTGMLGREIVRKFKDKSSYQLIGLSRKKSTLMEIEQVECDLYKTEKLLHVIEKLQPDIIIHAAGLVSLKTCEVSPYLADAIHVEATHILASYRPNKTKFIYISTDSVFDGKTGNYKETDLTKPLNYYSKSKLEGEKVAVQSNSKAVVFRANIYGVHSPSGNSLLEWALNELKRKNKITGFSDVFFNQDGTWDHMLLRNFSTPHQTLKPQKTKDLRCRGTI